MLLRIFLKVLMDNWIEIFESWIHYLRNWFVLWFFIKVACNEDWNVLVVLFKKFFNLLCLLNSLSHIFWFSFEMCFSKNEFIIVIGFQTKFAKHKKLAFTWWIWLLLRKQTIKLIFFIKDTWSWHWITLFEILICIS